MTLSEMSKQKFNSDMPLVPRSPSYQEAIYSHLLVFIEYLLCADTVTGMGTTAMNKGDKKLLLFGFHSSEKKQHINKSSI